MSSLKCGNLAAVFMPSPATSGRCLRFNGRTIRCRRDRYRYICTLQLSLFITGRLIVFIIQDCTESKQHVRICRSILMLDWPSLSRLMKSVEYGVQVSSTGSFCFLKAWGMTLRMLKLSSRSCVLLIPVANSSINVSLLRHGS